MSQSNFLKIFITIHINTKYTRVFRYWPLKHEHWKMCEEENNVTYPFVIVQINVSKKSKLDCGLFLLPKKKNSLCLCGQGGGGVGGGWSVKNTAKSKENSWNYLTYFELKNKVYLSPSVPGPLKYLGLWSYISLNCWSVVRDWATQKAHEVLF